MSEIKDSQMFSFDNEEATAEHDYQSAAEEPGPSDRASVDLFRRAMPEVEAEEDVCSICLDCWSEEDPAQRTSCGHSYHLQCIMQWAQRSRECPLCFRELALQVSIQEVVCIAEPRLKRIHWFEHLAQTF